MTETKTPSPSDEEIDAVALQCSNAYWAESGSRFNRDFARAVLAKWGAQPAPVREPLTDAQVKEVLSEAGYTFASARHQADFINGLRYAEAVHGITKGGQHGADR